MSPTPTVILFDPNKPSAPHRNHPSGNHQHHHVHSDQNDGLQEVPPVEKECKCSYDVLGIDQIHYQDQQSIRKNNKDTAKTKNKSEEQTKLLQKILNKRQKRNTVMRGNHKVIQ